MNAFQRLAVTLLLLLLGGNHLMAQDSSPLLITGSVDAYYKYDFSGMPNIGTSFADEQNSLSIGMVDLLFEKTTGKASFAAEIAFGPRGTVQSLPVEGVNIQNLYMSYAFTDKLSVTGGYMGTFVGYEVISPTGNFNYSTSYLFTNGPFQNAGVKLDYAFNDRFAVMIGVFNPWNQYMADPDFGLTSVGGQVYVAPVEGWDVYLNAITGTDGTEFDLTTTFQVTDAVMLGVNAASYSDGGEGSAAATFAGGAFYANVATSEATAVGLRYEYFMTSATTGILSEAADASVNAITLSGNLRAGGLTFIPEVRADIASEDIFVDSEGGATNTAAQFLLAAVFAF